MLQSARTTYAISAETMADSTLSSANLRETSGFSWGDGSGSLESAPSGYLTEAEQDAGAAQRLRIRGFAGMRPGRDVRPGQCAIAAAADADVRPHHGDFRDQRRVWQGPGPRRTRREAGSLVFRLPFQERPGDAGLSRPRRNVAAGRLLPRVDPRA